jgi:hypothetical protein
MIANKELSAKYFESTQSIIFDQIPISSVVNELKTQTEFEITNIQQKIAPKMEIGDVFCH